MAAPYYYPAFSNYSPYMQPQQQQGGFVSVRSEDEARNYPVAPGSSVTFRNEVEPYIYTKTMSLSQLDGPVFARYRLVKEETPNPAQGGSNSNDTWHLQKAEYEAILARLAVLEGGKKDE